MTTTTADQHAALATWANAHGYHYAPRWARAVRGRVWACRACEGLWVGDRALVPSACPYCGADRVEVPR